MIRRKVIGSGLAGFSLLALGLPISTVRAQGKYPDRPIRLIIPYAPGGATDIMGRKFAHKFGGLLGQNVVPDNKAGANGVIGTAEAARSKPDGYTYSIICSPAGTPQYIIDTIYRATLKVMVDTSFQKEIRDLGFGPVTDSNPEKAERFIKEEIAKWAPIIKATGAKLE